MTPYWMLATIGSIRHAKRNEAVVRHEDGGDGILPGLDVDRNNREALGSVLVEHLLQLREFIPAIRGVRDSKSSAGLRGPDNPTAGPSWHRDRR